MTGKKKLGSFIAAKRRNMGLTQEQFAEKVGVSKSAIAKWETDGGIPDRDNMKRVSEVIKVTVDNLYSIMEESEVKRASYNTNITAEIIALLEAHGYKVVKPNQHI